MQDTEKWCSMQEITEYLGVSRETILNWIEKRNMPAIKAGRLWKFKISVVDAWLKSGGAIPMVSLLDLQSTSMPSIAKKFVESHLSPRLSIISLKEALRILITSIADQIPKVDFSSVEIEEMINDAMCSCLVTWLMDAKNTHYDPYNFTKERHPLWHHDDNEFKLYKSGIESGVEAYYQRYYNTLNTKSIDEQKSNPHLIALFFAEFYYDNGSREGLSLFRDLYYRTEELRVKGKSKRNVIIDGYNQYFQLLRLISEEKDDKTYVAQVLTYVQIEWLHRFLLSYQIWNATDNFSEQALTALSLGVRNYYHQITTKEKVIALSSVRFGDKLLDKICNNQLTSIDAQKIYWSRVIMQTALDTLYSLAPADCFTADWTKDTFKEAARFFREDYKFDNIVKAINQDINWDNKEESQVNTLREIILNNYNPLQLNIIRDFIRSKNKAKNQRNRKRKDSKLSENHS